MSFIVNFNNILNQIPSMDQMRRVISSIDKDSVIYAGKHILYYAKQKPLPTLLGTIATIYVTCIIGSLSAGAVMWISGKIIQQIPTKITHQIGKGLQKWGMMLIKQGFALITVPFHVLSYLLAFVYSWITTNIIWPTLDLFFKRNTNPTNQEKNTNHESPATQKQDNPITALAAAANTLTTSLTPQTVSAFTAAANAISSITPETVNSFTAAANTLTTSLTPETVNSVIKSLSRLAECGEQIAIPFTLIAFGLTAYTLTYTILQIGIMGIVAFYAYLNSNVPSESSAN